MVDDTLLSENLQFKNSTSLYHQQPSQHKSLWTLFYMSLPITDCTEKAQKKY